MESYIEDKKNLYTSIYKFFDESDEHNDESFQKLINIIRSQQIEGDEEEMRQFLEIINSIGEHHHRDQQFNERMNQLLLHYKDQIKQTLSNTKIFHIFENNKKIVHFLLKEDIMTISDELYKEMIYKVENNYKRYFHFFIPELEKFVGEEKMKFVKSKLLKDDPNFFVNYEEKREEGENDSYICTLIRKDSVEEFITYLNRYNISPLSHILPSIFETNPFLIDNKDTTLIEYSAFFGSIQIFQYLLMNNAELTPSLWLYAIHSKNAELIHLLESANFLPLHYKNENYVRFLNESIKCHHNDFAEYIENNLIIQNEIDDHKREEILSNYIKYHNYSYFQNEEIIDHGFFYLSFYHYNKLSELLLKKKEKEIEEKMIQYKNIRTMADKNEVEVIYHFLLKTREITDEYFSETKIKQISIPFSVHSIQYFAFNGCKSLTHVAIPSSVVLIESHAFYECSSLKEITIPSSVTEIGDYAFNKCSSLTQITIPSTVTEIGISVFYGCSSLTIIVIPYSVTEIGDYAFHGCSSLREITIPSSVTSIGNFAFNECSSLTQITILSSVTSIGEYAFSGCSSLTQITIHSSITSIGKGAFNGCFSVQQITILSTGNLDFKKCLNLLMKKIPSKTKEKVIFSELSIEK